MKIEEIFRAASASVSRCDVVYLLSMLIGVDVSYVLAHMEEELDKSIEKEISEALSRVKEGEPIQYVVNRADFWGMELYVEKGVFIPREDTESLIYAVKEVVPGGKGLMFIDIGTGSGNIALALAKEFKDAAMVIGVDVSEKAVKVATFNADKNGIDVRFVCSDMFTAISESCNFDVIVSNPPYIPSRALATLPLSVRKFEPLSALDGGPDGLNFYRKLFKCAEYRLKKGGVIVVEIDKSVKEGIMKLIENFKKCKVFKDYFGNERALVCWR